jgi:hypothetical protein
MDKNLVTPELKQLHASILNSLEQLDEAFQQKKNVLKKMRFLDI